MNDVHICVLIDSRKKIMTSSSSTTNQRTDHYRYTQQGCCLRGNWSGFNFAAMVIGFVFFWPVGLLILYWNISGRNVKDLPGAIQEKWSTMAAGSFCGSIEPAYSNSENSVFDEYQQTQYDRITEIKEEIKNRAHSFRNFRKDLKRRADEAEFKEFMSSDHSKDEN